MAVAALGGGRRGGGLVKVKNGDTRTLLGEQPGGRKADSGPARSTGYDGGLAVEQHWVSLQNIDLVARHARLRDG
jgi:hypothetical protein